MVSNLQANLNFGGFARRLRVFLETHTSRVDTEGSRIYLMDKQSTEKSRHIFFKDDELSASF